MSKETSGPRERGRVLVVDDDNANRNLLRVQLEEQRFEVLTAATGEQCLEVAMASSPEVILLDIEMPGMDGIETCRQLKQKLETARIPVLFITGHRDDEPTTLEALEAGGNDFVSKDASLAVLVARLQSQLAIYRAQADLRRAAMTDDLTGVYSRRFLFDALRRAVKGLHRNGPRSVACMLLDVDRFKAVNDGVGHLQADRVLRQIAATVNRSTRETDLVARFGGDEFLVIIFDTEPAAVKCLAERVREEVRMHCGSVTVSIGMAALAAEGAWATQARPEVDNVVAKLIERADQAMYKAKAMGGDRVAIWTEDMQRETKASTPP